MKALAKKPQPNQNSSATHQLRDDDLKYQPACRAADSNAPAPLSPLLHLVGPEQLIVGVLAFVIGVLTLMLPETLGQPLTSTLEEAENLGREPSKKKKEEEQEAGLEMNQQPIKA